MRLRALPLLLVRTGAISVGYLGDVADGTFLDACHHHAMTPVTRSCTALDCGALDPLADLIVVTPLTGVALAVAAAGASTLNITLLATRATVEGNYFRLNAQPRAQLRALVDLCALYDWQHISAVVSASHVDLAQDLDGMLRATLGTGLQVLATTLNDASPISLSGAKVAFALGPYDAALLAKRVGSVEAWLTLDVFGGTGLVASSAWDAHNATSQAVALAATWDAARFDHDDAYILDVVVKHNGTVIWNGSHLTPSRFDGIGDGRGCDVGRTAAARFFCEACPVEGGAESKRCVAFEL